MPASADTRSTSSSLVLDLLDRLQEALDRFVQRRRRSTLLEDSNHAFAALREDKAAWDEEIEERRLWEGTLADGIEADERSDAVTR